LRNAAQPLPDLAVDKGWSEAPFWIWTKSDPIRRSLWWSRSGNDVLLSDAQRTTYWTLNNALRTNDDGFERLCALCDNEFSLRPRALTNTMFLRMLCCDTFVHGIGGAKYDQVTDLLMFDLFSIEPPGFISLSQTTLLPVEAELSTQRDYVENRRILREMHFHPERFLDKALRDTPKVSSIEKNKEKWIATILDRGKRQKRHDEIAAANAELRGYLQEKAEKQKKFLNDLESALRVSQVLGSREWSFCLFPKAFLKKRLLDLRGADP
jgi:hypothetical protein